MRAGAGLRKLQSHRSFRCETSPNFGPRSYCRGDFFARWRGGQRPLPAARPSASCSAPPCPARSLLGVAPDPPLAPLPQICACLASSRSIQRNSGLSCERGIVSPIRILLSCGNGGQICHRVTLRRRSESRRLPIISGSTMAVCPITIWPIGWSRKRSLTRPIVDVTRQVGGSALILVPSQELRGQHQAAEQGPQAGSEGPAA